MAEYTHNGRKGRFYNQKTFNTFERIETPKGVIYFLPNVREIRPPVDKERFEKDILAGRTLEYVLANGPYSSSKIYTFMKNTYGFASFIEAKIIIINEHIIKLQKQMAEALDEGEALFYQSQIDKYKKYIADY